MRLWWLILCSRTSGRGKNLVRTPPPHKELMSVKKSGCGGTPVTDRQAGTGYLYQIEELL